MKHVPGKLALLLVLLCTALAAAPYEWSVSSSKSGLYANEALSVTYRCRFEDSGSNYVIDFDPLKSAGPYTMHSLSENEQIVDGKRINEYRYVLFPHEAGELTLSYEALMRRTTKESIENTVLGRDNMEDFDFTDTVATLPTVKVDVKPASGRLTGSFSMSMEIDKRPLKAYEPLHLSVSIEGEGNFEAIAPLQLAIEGVEVFAEAPQKEYRLEENGYRGRYVQQFALVAKEDFAIPPFAIDYFDLSARQPATLKTEAHTISVTPAYSPEELLDEEGEEEAGGFVWEWVYLNYLLVFITGVGVGRWLRRKKSEEEALPEWMEQVNGAEDVRSLLMLLVVHGDKRCEGVIESMEKEGEGYGLKRAKKEARACMLK